MPSKQLPTPGQRIELVRMPQDPDPVPPGTPGTVLSVEAFGQSHIVRVAWDNGRTLAMLAELDEWLVREG